MDINGIQKGTRHRRDLGDLASLAQSIGDVGLLHPVVVTPNGTLIAGERRWEACRLLGWDDIPVTVVDLEEVARGEFAENSERKDFLPTERVAILKALKPEEEAAAKERKKAGQREGGKTSGRGRKASGKVSLKQSGGKTTDKVAAFAGTSGRTLEKAAAVVQAAEAEPEKFGDLVEEMDKTGKVDATHRKLKQRRTRAKYEERKESGGTVANLADLAAAGRRFGVIYADPPWHFKTRSDKGKEKSADRHYDTASLADIMAMPVAPLAADDCVLFMWATWPHLPEALELIKAWGFEYKTCGFLWMKQNPSGNGLHLGMGFWTRANTEPCLLATRGNPLRMAEDVRQSILSPVGEHSVKPEEARHGIMRLVVGPYLELFGRQPVEEWTVWGNEVAQCETA